MKQTTAAAQMPAFKESLPVRDRRDCDVRSRERMEGELDRLRTRERLEATLAGLGELEYLRQRQELLVRGVLSLQENPTFSGEDNVCGAVEESYISSEEKLLEENILLLKKQLNCLRRRDAGLIGQLQELDRQISDLRLDNRKTSHEHVESDSRPSSGFYELSDGASGSLSNSSNSVFSECLSSCQSSTCFCSPLESSLNASEGQPKSTDDLGECVECEGPCEEQNSGVVVSRSYSASYSPSVDSTCDGQSKYHCDLVARNGSDVYRYPSPLHAVAVQSPMFFQSIVNHLKEENVPLKSAEPLGDLLKPEQPLASQSTPWPSSCMPTNKRLDNYIFSLLQRKAQPVRTSRPRTSINTDPSKSILRQGSLCVRQASSQSQGKTPDHKASWQGTVHAGAVNGMDTSVGSPLKQWAADARAEPPEDGKPHLLGQAQNEHLTNGSETTNSLSKQKGAIKGPLLCSASKNIHKLGNTLPVSSPKDSRQPYFPTVVDNKTPQAVKVCTPKKCPKSPATAASCLEERPALELVSLGSSSQSQDEGVQMVNAQYIPGQQQMVKVRKGGKNVKIVKVRSAALKSRSHGEPPPEAGRDRQRAAAKRCRFPEDMSNPTRSSKKSSSRAKRIPASIPEDRVVDKHPLPTTSRQSMPRHHAHGRETVVAKPKHKRNDYRRLRSISDAPYEEALRRARRRQKQVILGHVSAMYLSSGAQQPSPYAYVGSDSEYSAECASLFHSTILDTSEDERSNYTTNCFGDSESSLSEVDFAGESTTTSDSEESGGVNWPQFGKVSGPPLGQEMTPGQAKAFVKIKASHNLKKKILRFRSGSLKLMTTV